MAFAGEGRLHGIPALHRLRKGSGRPFVLRQRHLLLAEEVLEQTEGLASEGLVEICFVKNGSSGL
jgi:hypothetical protein